MALRMLTLFRMKQTVAAAKAGTRTARLAGIVAASNGKAPAGVRLLDLQELLSPAQINKGKLLERMARRLRDNGDKTLERMPRRVRDGGNAPRRAASKLSS